MSALENAVRVNSEKQTLILAGEAIPRRGVVESLAGRRGLAYPDSQPPLTIVATPVDELTPLSGRGNSYSAANAYARTQELSGGGPRSAIIDTYA